jgi:signal transduction histidine kinase
MNGLNGLEVCRQIKSSPKGSELYIILLSSLRTFSDHQSEGLESGADGYIARPIQNRELLARVEAALRIIRTEKDLRNALEKSINLEMKLNELNATKDLFFSIIAHDLKNPFNTILGFSEMLLEDKIYADSSKVQECLKIISETTRQTSYLLDNLLIWAKSQTGKIEFQPADFNLRESVSATLAILQSQANAKSINVFNEISDSLWLTADKNMINTVLRNLLSNAVKFTPSNGRIVLASSEKNHQIAVSVTDTGTGISKERLEKLFKIENIISTPGTEKEKGTGLGLILCKDFIEKHNGEIWAESEPGKGSKFIFTLPRNNLAVNPINSV